MSDSDSNDDSYGEETPCSEEGCNDTALKHRTGSQCEECGDWYCQACSINLHSHEYEETSYCSNCAWECSMCEDSKEEEEDEV